MQITVQPGSLSGATKLFWRAIQAVFLLFGLFIIICLFFFPTIGLMLFWNFLIPVAPLTLFLATGLWRNVCPLATINLLPRHFGLSKRKKISQKLSGILSLISAVALFVIVPLRHPIFNQNGAATAILLVSTGICSVTLGMFYEWKSAWCSGLCPIHGVEKLYGGNVPVTFANAHCQSCMNCVVPCPDSTINITPRSSTKTIYHKMSGWLITGGLPGFIWGWFQTPDDGYNPHVVSAYMIPIAGLLASMAVYTLLSLWLPRQSKNSLTGFFAAASISCYYWYRLPQLFGIGKFSGDGVLIDMSQYLSPAVFYTFTSALVLFFFYRLFINAPNRKSWLARPAFAYHLKRNR